MEGQSSSAVTFISIFSLKISIVYADRWGGSGWTRSMIAGGRKDGANFSNWKWWPHTLKSHQLVQYFATKVPATSSSSTDGGSSLSPTSKFSTDKVNQYLFEAEYERGENISKMDTLMSIAKDLLESGRYDDKDAILKDLENYLTESKGAQDVQEEINLGRQRYRISGVPYFIIGVGDPSTSSRRPYGLSGAQAPETSVELFEELSGDA